MKLKTEQSSNSMLVGPHVFNCESGILLRGDGKKIYMENRLRDMFAVLIQNADEFVSKQDLMEMTWIDTIVSIQSVSKAISDLRKLLKMHEIDDIQIISIRKRGYKLEVILADPPIKRNKIKKLLPYTFIVAIMLMYLLLHH